MVAVIASAALNAGQSAAQPPAVTLTQVGSPIWRPADIQVFSAPDNETTRVALRGPNDPPPTATTYTTPHGPPYDSELSTNMAAAGFVSRSVFTREALDRNPNVIFLPWMLLPDPGITGSSRDFASGPVIPNSLFPMSGHTERWYNGALADTGDPQVVLRPTDLPFEGTSHRLLFSTFWNTGADNLGDYEFRSSVRDTQGYGWDWVLQFKVVAELPPGDFNQNGTVDAADYVVWRKGLGTTYTQSDYNTWRANFGTSLLAGSGSALPSAAPLPAVPEPSTLLIACIAAIGIGAAARRRTRQGGPPCIA
jgi:hypothetical protein